MVGSARRAFTVEIGFTEIKKTMQVPTPRKASFANLFAIFQMQLQP